MNRITFTWLDQPQHWSFGQSRLYWDDPATSCSTLKTPTKDLLHPAIKCSYWMLLVCIILRCKDPSCKTHLRQQRSLQRHSHLRCARGSRLRAERLRRVPGWSESYQGHTAWRCNWLVTSDILWYEKSWMCWSWSRQTSHVFSKKNMRTAQGCQTKIQLSKWVTNVTMK